MPFFEAVSAAKLDEMQRRRKLGRLCLFGVICACFVIVTLQAKQKLFRDRQFRSYLYAPASLPDGDGRHLCVFASLAALQVPPRIGRCLLPLSVAALEDHVEADLRYGTFVLRQNDLQLSAEPDVALIRGYNSGYWPGTNGSAAFGVHSSHSFDLAPLGSRNPYLDQVLVLADGQTVYFKRISAGTGFADAVYRHSETFTRFYGAVTGWDGDGWATLLRDGSVIRFPESYNATSLAQGAAVEMREGSGRPLRLERNQNRTLKQVADDRGHWLAFTYDNSERVTRLVNDQGDWVRYLYNEQGLLAAVMHPGGDERHYVYHGGRMTSITDEKGRVLLQNEYDGTFLHQQQYADGSIYEYTYILDIKGTYADRVTVTGPDHQSQTFSAAADVLPSSR